MIVADLNWLQLTAAAAFILATIIAIVIIQRVTQQQPGRDWYRRFRGRW